MIIFVILYYNRHFIWRLFFIMCKFINFDVFDFNTIPNKENGLYNKSYYDINLSYDKGLNEILNYNDNSNLYVIIFKLKRRNIKCTYDVLLGVTDFDFTNESLKNVNTKFNDILNRFRDIIEEHELSHNEIYFNDVIDGEDSYIFAYNRDHYIEFHMNKQDKHNEGFLYNHHPSICTVNDVDGNYCKFYTRVMRFIRR